MLYRHTQRFRVKPMRLGGIGQDYQDRLGLLAKLLYRFRGHRCR